LNSILIVGYGEVGKPMYEISRGIYPKVDWLDVEEKYVASNPSVMHICFPFKAKESFVKNAVGYIERYDPELVLIESTVAPGTTISIHEKLERKPLLCHSPVRGNMTEGMKKGLFQYTKFIGPVTPEAGIRAKEYYDTLGFKTKIANSPIDTELSKIFETTYRGIMMAWFQEMNRICDRFGASFDEITDFLGTTEKEGRQARPIFHPGFIGGHCIIPNAEILEEVYPSKFAEALLESNKKRAEELSKTGQVQQEVNSRSF
jgi:UDP-N-acetyl-D-mannosaminuronate dehydrogenase